MNEYSSVGEEKWPELEERLHYYNRRIEVYDLLTNSPPYFTEARDVLGSLMVNKFGKLETEACNENSRFQIEYLAILSGGAQAWLHHKGVPPEEFRHFIRSYLFCRTDADLDLVRELSGPKVHLTGKNVIARYFNIGWAEMNKLC